MTMRGVPTVTTDEKRAKELRRKAGHGCVTCGGGTGMLNDVGEVQCGWCQRELRRATEHAVAECGCGNPMLSEAERCGFCEAEMAAV